MRTAGTLALAGAVLAGPAAVAAEHDLMPAPVAVELRAEGFPLDRALTVALVGPRNDRLERALERLAARLSVRVGQPLDLQLLDDARRASLVVRCAGTTGPFPSLGEDESYHLSVSPDGVTLEAPGPLGVVRGLATLAQLAAPEDDGWILSGAEIEDAPRFPWRGLMIDVVRHWQPVEVLERNLDAMEAVKLNVLHLHLTDDQGFRVESRRYPLLHERGTDGNYYSQDEIRHLLQHAADRGIRIVPEFDVPGHTTSWLVAYPELLDPPLEGLELPLGMGMFPHTLDPTREETYEFLDRLFGEMAELFPDQFFHVGGDEVKSATWQSDERIQAFMDERGMASPRELQGHFTSRILPLVAALGKTPVGWDEIARVELGPDAVVQVWLPGVDPAPNRSVVSDGFYLDRGLSAARHYANDPLELLPREARAGLLGGEACLWSEFVTSATIDSRLWPRTAAIAERLWSPSEVRDVPDMYRRLSLVRADLARLGLQHDSYYEPALAGLTGDALSPALETLADVSVSPGVLDRLFSYPVLGAMFAPSLSRALVDPPEVGTRFEDVIRPESDTGAAFQAEVEGFLAGPGSVPHRRVVEQRLRGWRDNHAEVVKLFATHPDLEEIEPVSEGLRDLADLGLSALDVLDGQRSFSAREKRRHLELLALLDPSPLDLRDIDFPEGQELADALPQVVGRLLVERLSSLEPLIVFRVKIAAQPGVASLVQAAHAKGTREVGLVENAAWALYDRRGTILTVVVAAALLVLFLRRRRRKRAARKESS